MILEVRAGVLPPLMLGLPRQQPCHAVGKGGFAAGTGWALPGSLQGLKGARPGWRSSGSPVALKCEFLASFFPAWAFPAAVDACYCQ